MEREGLTLARSTVRGILSAAGLASPRHRRPPLHRCRRERMPREGVLVQIDGSYHNWLENRGPWLTLLLAVDDAPAQFLSPYSASTKMARGTSDCFGEYVIIVGSPWRYTPIATPFFNRRLALMRLWKNAYQNEVELR